MKAEDWIREKVKREGIPVKTAEYARMDWLLEKIHKMQRKMDRIDTNEHQE